MKMIENTFDLTEFNSRFSTIEDCLDYAYAIRWENGYICSRCRCSEFWEVSPYKYKCRNCGYQSTVTAGTFFHRTHLSMLQWFQAIYYLSVSREKSTATELQSVVGLGSNRTAQTVYQKIKPFLYCSSPEKIKWINNQLEGLVEIESKYIDFGNNRYGIYIAVEVRDSKIGRIRIKPYQSTKDFSRNFKELYVSQSATIVTPKRYTSRSHVRMVAEDLEKWCVGKEKYDFQKLLSFYCHMINIYNTPITFDELLRNILSGNQPPRHDSSLI